MPEILAQLIIDGKTTIDKIENNPKYTVFADRVIEILKEKDFTGQF